MFSFTKIIACFSRIARGWPGWPGSSLGPLKTHFVLLHLVCDSANHLSGTSGVELWRSSTPDMRRQRVYHEAELLKHVSGSSAFPILHYLPTIMAPRTHYAKSQEIVYKSMGTAARPRFKAVHAKLPAKKQSSNSDALSSEPPVPPIVDSPQGAGDQFGPNEGSSFLDFETSQRKKKVLNLFPIYF
jgi:hypothetical protein